MRIKQTEKKDIQKIGQYMTRMNHDLHTRCTYLGEDEQETIDCLEEILDEYEESCYYIEEDGEIVAAIAVDRTEDNKGVEVLGPYVNQDLEEKYTYAMELILTLKKVAPGYRLKFFHPVQNTFIKEVMLKMNAKLNGGCYEMEISLDSNAKDGTTTHAYEFYSKKDGSCKDIGAQIADLHDKIFPRAYYNGATLVGMIDECNRLIYCQKDGRVTAYALFNEEEGYLDFIATVPEYRNQGYAKTLLWAICDQLRKGGSKIVNLTVDDNDVEAINLYCNYGFEEKSYNQSFAIE